jgi:hypothetical protein
MKESKAILIQLFYLILYFKLHSINNTIYNTNPLFYNTHMQCQCS